jgi:hypothetical protein
MTRSIFAGTVLLYLIRTEKDSFIFHLLLLRNPDLSVGLYSTLLFRRYPSPTRNHNFIRVLPYFIYFYHYFIFLPFLSGEGQWNSMRVLSCCTLVCAVRSTWYWKYYYLFLLCVLQHYNDDTCCFDMFYGKYITLCTGLNQYIALCTGLNQYIALCTGLNQYIALCTGNCPMYSPSTKY